MRLSSSTIANAAFTLACVYVSYASWESRRNRDVSPLAGQPAVASVETVDFSIAVRQATSHGNQSAQAIIVEYFDVECPFCRQLTRRVMPELVRRYVDSGKARYLGKHLPLSIHPGAVPGAAFVECAGQQGFFSPAKQLAMERPLRTNEERLGVISGIAGVNRAALQQCIDGPVQSVVMEDVSEAGRVGVKHTPTVLLALAEGMGSARVKKRIVGLQDVEVYRNAMDDLLASAAAR